MAPNKDLTEKDHILIVNAWKSLKTPPEIDWDKFARLGAYTNPASGRNAMAAIRKKLDAQAEAGGEQPMPGPSKATPGKRKAAGKRRNAEVEGDDKAAPAKAAKRGPMKSAKFVEESEEDAASAKDAEKSDKVAMEESEDAA